MGWPFEIRSATRRASASAPKCPDIGLGVPLQHSQAILERPGPSQCSVGKSQAQSWASWGLTGSAPDRPQGDPARLECPKIAFVRALGGLHCSFGFKHRLVVATSCYLVFAFSAPRRFPQRSTQPRFRACPAGCQRFQPRLCFLLRLEDFNGLHCGFGLEHLRLLLVAASCSPFFASWVPGRFPPPPSSFSLENLRIAAASCILDGCIKSTNEANEVTRSRTKSREPSPGY